MSHRQERVGHAIHREISSLIESEVRDPRLENVTVTDVRVSGDLRIATIYYTSHEDDKPEEVQHGLEAATGFMRRALAKRLDLRFAPDLKFIADPQIEKGERLLKLLEQLRGEREN